MWNNGENEGRLNMQYNNKATVFILLGQSNAVGHGIPMREEDKIIEPMENVFGLSRDFNQSFENTELKWSGYTSFGMNLAEEQDNTYSLGSFGRMKLIKETSEICLICILFISQ